MYEREEKLQERELKVEIAGDIQLEADATLLEQLLCNLLDNAVKYASKNTTICVIMKDREISIQNICELHGFGFELICKEKALKLKLKDRSLLHALPEAGLF